jgi:hypothetical protein
MSAGVTEFRDLTAARQNGSRPDDKASLRVSNGKAYAFVRSWTWRW